VAGFDPISAGLDIAGKLIDRLWPDPAQRDAAKLELMKMQQSGELAEMTAQTSINAAEAASSSPFVAGWRPFIGWVCGSALAYQYVLCPLAMWVGFVVGHPIPKPPTLDDTLWQLMFGMLGMGGLRTFEKIKGVSK
jgi:hypothetical protein